MRYCKFLTRLFEETFPLPEDYELEDEDGFQLAAVTALVKGIRKFHAESLPAEGPAGDARQLVLVAITGDERALRVKIKALEDEIATLRVGMEDRKIIERAKGILMTTGISEGEAYKRLQNMASRHNMKLPVLARKVLELTDLFEAQ